MSINMNYSWNNENQSSIKRVPIHLFLLDDVDIEQHRKWRKDNERFWNVMKPVIAVSQFFGYFPITGIRNSSPNECVFKFPSFITSYSLMIISFMGIGFAAALNRAIHSTKSEFMWKLSNTIFYGYSCLGLLLIFWKSSKWIKLQINWLYAEKKLDNFSSFHQKTFRQRSKLRTISLIFFFFATIDYLCGYKYSISKASAAIHFTAIDCKLFVGIIGAIIRTLATFACDFCELLIILVSMGLAERYKHLNEVVHFKVSNNSTERINWRKIKKTYIMMNELVKEADDIISPLILLSCCINVYQICGHTSEAIRSVTTDTKIPVYQFLTSIFLVFRTMSVVWSAAKIDIESKHALLLFSRCHPSVFIVEVFWIQQQLSIDKVSLTAMKFFPITRQFILTITGTIITYQIVYMQFLAVH